MMGVEIGDGGEKCSAGLAGGDTLQFISKTHRREFDRRRRYEWRTLITTLTFYVLAAAAVLKGDAPPPHNCEQVIFVIGTACILAVISIIYLHYIHSANARNKDFAQAAENCLMWDADCPELTGMLKDKPCTWTGCPRITCGANWSWYWQAVTIIAFALASAILIINHPAKQSEPPTPTVASKCLQN
jgi:hypothetical protein